VHGQRQGKEFTLGDIGVIPIIQMLLDAGTDLLSDVWENITSLQFLKKALNNLNARNRINSQWVCVHETLSMVGMIANRL
jgi:hypothetical protein